MVVLAFVVPAAHAPRETHPSSEELTLQLHSSSELVQAIA
jgi:hypothetical protein